VNRHQVAKWLSDYVDAWRHEELGVLANIFAGDVVYAPSPWREPMVGLDTVKRFWERARSGHDEAFKIATSIVAVENSVTVVRVEVEYLQDAPSSWRDLWIVYFNAAGLCQRFEEWPFSERQDDGQDEVLAE
jgi:hypothetical protein